MEKGEKEKIWQEDYNNSASKNEDDVALSFRTLEAVKSFRTSQDLSKRIGQFLTISKRIRRDGFRRGLHRDRRN